MIVYNNSDPTTPTFSINGETMAKKTIIRKKVPKGQKQKKYPTWAEFAKMNKAGQARRKAKKKK